MNHRKNKLIQTMLARRDWSEQMRTGLYEVESTIVPKTYISIRELNKYLRGIGAPKTNENNKIWSYIGRLATIKRCAEGVVDLSDTIISISTLYYIANNYGVNHFSNIASIYQSLDKYSRSYLLKNKIHISNSTFHSSTLLEINATKNKDLISIQDCDLDVYQYPDWFEGNKSDNTPIKTLDIVEIDTDFPDDIEASNARCYASINGIYVIDNHYIKLNCLTASLQEIEAQTFEKCRPVDKEKFIEIRNLFIEEVRKHVKY